MAVTMNVQELTCVKSLISLVMKGAVTVMKSDHLLCISVGRASQYLIHDIIIMAAWVEECNQ